MHHVLLYEHFWHDAVAPCRPLSMSENLTKLAHKIDFSVDEPEKLTEASTAETDSDKTSKEQEKAKFQPSLWPWDSVRNKLK